MRSDDGSPKAPKKRPPAEPFDRLRRRLAHADDGWLFASIAAQVTERRLALGLSQVELARLCSTSQSAIARLENGGRPPRIDTLLRLAEALDCDPPWSCVLATPAPAPRGGPDGRYIRRTEPHRRDRGRAPRDDFRAARALGRGAGDSLAGDAGRRGTRRRTGTGVCRPGPGSCPSVRGLPECAHRFAAARARRHSRRGRSTSDPALAETARVGTAAQLAEDWDLLGPRGFAIIGGAVTAFGIILLFVLAANRGWITPTMRVAIGACASAAAVGVAFWVRSRYGQLQMSLGAAGAGIAGGYATLAAAAARYDLVPDWLALPLAGGLAALAVVIAIAWSSETVAAIGLLGAALAPALQAIDTGLSWPSVAFAVIILGATVALAVPRRWHRLLIGIGVVVGAQVHCSR